MTAYERIADVIKNSAALPRGGGYRPITAIGSKFTAITIDRSGSEGKAANSLFYGVNEFVQRLFITPIKIAPGVQGKDTSRGQ